MKYKTYDLDNVLMTEQVYNAWVAYSLVCTQELMSIYPNLEAHEIGDEHLRVYEDGSAALAVKVRKKLIKKILFKKDYAIQKKKKQR